MRPLLPLLAAALPALTQDPVRQFPTPSAIQANAQAADAAADLHFDVAADDTVGVAARSWKAAVHRRGWTFAARPEAGHPDAPVAFGLETAVVGGKALTTSALHVSRTGNRITVTRDGFAERFDASPTGIEHSFWFPTLPQRGELQLRLRVTSALRGEDDGDGIDFVGPGGIHYGEAIAIDAHGERTAAPTSWQDGQIVLTVPAAFVERCALPLLIDPLVAPITPITSPYPLTEPDASWDEGASTWLLVWERAFSATDSDLFARRFDAAMQPLGTAFALDLSVDSWQRPRVADHGPAGTFLVVAQTSADTAPPFWVAGRTVAASTGVPAAPFIIEKAGVSGHATGDKLWPDVGGDVGGVGQGWFTVVWARKYAVLDHDIHMKQVGPDGSLRTVSPVHVDNGIEDDRQPSISRSSGPAPRSEQRLAIAFARTPRVGGAALRGAFSTWDGQIVGIGGASSFPIAGALGFSGHGLPTVSTAAVVAGSRQWLFCSTPADTVWCHLVDANGNVVFANSLPAMQGQAGMPSALGAVVETDGCRFVVAWTQAASVQALLTRAALIGSSATGLRVDEGPFNLGATDVTWQSAVASRYAGSGVPSTRHLLARSSTQPGPAIEAWGYDGIAPGGVTMRAAGCGGLTTVVTGRPVLGETITFTLTDANGPAGFLVGPAIPALPFGPCLQCTIAVVGETVFGATLPIPVPCNPTLVGGTISFQGFALQGGTCLGSIRAGDAYDVDIQ
ncbi:MAG: hypothetical protein IPK26_24390 [Planctomycetes bacterium]|nr:hypothetical protein [Planctomycetota bacterium]